MIPRHGITAAHRFLGGWWVKCKCHVLRDVIISGTFTFLNLRAASWKLKVNQFILLLRTFVWCRIDCHIPKDSKMSSIFDPTSPEEAVWRRESLGDRNPHSQAWTLRSKRSSVWPGQGNRTHNLRVSQRVATLPQEERPLHVCKSSWASPLQQNTLFPWLLFGGGSSIYDLFEQPKSLLGIQDMKHCTRWNWSK